MRPSNVYRAGLDIGSTTAKIVLLDDAGTPVFSDYKRHHAQIYETIICFFREMRQRLGDCTLDLTLTGSAALGVSKQLGLPFVQEVIATHVVLQILYPEVEIAVDIGGEDSKMIFLNPDKPPDIRMNGSCAGGTGSFIDQMASLLNITPFELDALAGTHDHIYPVASRCGVFAKTDVQNMLSRNIPHRDIAASIFHAVAVQCINSLARGKELNPKILLCGGVFAFLPQLVNAFLRVLTFARSDMVMPERSELIPATGAAMFDKYKALPVSMSQLIVRMEKELDNTDPVKGRIDPLFRNPGHFTDWKARARIISIPCLPLSAVDGQECFLGIDSGSTTTKIVVITKNREILYSRYTNNNGNPIETVIAGLMDFRQQVLEEKTGIHLAGTAVTGYGEDLIRTAFHMDKGVVETIAHFRAARFLDPEVSFILDIGGQDMKAVFVDHGVISRIELNEACSSGCGSFLETLAGSLNFSIQEFAGLACRANSPCDLGSRCTVFMNSKIKQSLRENAKIGDISAGLSYSMIRNCLFKVLRLHNMDELGEHIVLQGGAFKNPSIVRALEILTEKQVTYSNCPELMGAFGAALIAREEYSAHPEFKTGFSGLDRIEEIRNYTTSHIPCRGCENNCRVTRFVFTNGESFFSGNKCEKYYGAKGQAHTRGFNFVTYKNDLMFNRDLRPNADPVLTLGIPRCLDFFENFVFWHTLFTLSNINIRLSPPSTIALSEKGMGTVMSDNICFPAKLVHGHIYDLIEQKDVAGSGVDRIFYPLVVFERKEFNPALNAYNCPIVTGYADVIESAVDPDGRFHIPLDRPAVNFNDESLLKKTCETYLRQFNIDRGVIHRAFKAAIRAQNEFKAGLRNRAEQLIHRAETDHSLLIVLAGRPYHCDSLINHKIPDILTGLGADIITEDALVPLARDLEDVQVVTQWSYPNRIYAAAKWVAGKPDNIQMVQLNSFGCGPDAVVIDEVREILGAGGKNHTLIKVDEVTSPGSVRLRLRSMLESLKGKRTKQAKAPVQRKPFVPFGREDRKRTIWAPFFSEDYSAYLPAVFQNAGYQLKVLPKPDRKSVDIGLQYANNDICYPGIIVIGDIVKALKTQLYHPDDIAIGITQTGGQCRASNYLPLIRKAMIRAGFDDIPIISVTASQGLIDQSGFQINWLFRMKILFVGTMFADCIAKMYYATAPREKTKGRAQELRQMYMEKIGPCIVRTDYSGIFKLLEKAVDDFNRILVHEQDLPRMGVVGEIYAKYNYFANQDLVHWLIRQGIEPVLPPIVDYFIQDLVNFKENIKAGIRRRKASDLLGLPVEWMIRTNHERINALFSRFRYGLPFEDIREVAQKASGVLTLTHQFGEGWLIPGEILTLAGQGIHDVVSLQPFGCVANHIVSKGMEKKIKKVCPEMNVYYLDFDAGMSEANIRNRLHFMIEHMV